MINYTKIENNNEKQITWIRPKQTLMTQKIYSIQKLSRKDEVYMCQATMQHLTLKPLKS